MMLELEIELILLIWLGYELEPVQELEQEFFDVLLATSICGHCDIVMTVPGLMLSSDRALKLVRKIGARHSFRCVTMLKLAASLDLVPVMDLKP